MTGLWREVIDRAGGRSREALKQVELALAKLEEREIVELDQERKAAMVSNLLVVLCSEQNTQPIVNAGTLYQ